MHMFLNSKVRGEPYLTDAPPTNENSPRRRVIEIRKLKDFALKLPPNSILREILLLEDDELDVHTFLARMPIWLKLIRGLEDGRVR